MLFLKNVAFTILVPGTVAVYVPILIAGGNTPAHGAALFAGVLLITMGTGIYGWCVRDFAIHGSGTPAPIDAPTRLVVRGLYRWIRNPMYVGVLAVIQGWAVLFRSTSVSLYGVAVAACFHLFVVLYEEPRMRREFGDRYDDYVRRTGRWIPRRVT